MAHFIPMFLCIFVIFLVLNASAVDLGGRKVVGGWNPVDPNDKTVIEIGKFAVSEHNKKNSRIGDKILVFRKVVKGEKQVMLEIEYRLTVEATFGGNATTYLAIVTDQPKKNFRRLISFVPDEKAY